MEFVIITVAIMTISILLIYKISQYMNIDINLQPLVLCGILALLVNFSALTVSSYLSTSHFILLGALVLLSSTVATWYNQRLIHIHETGTAPATVQDDVPTSHIFAAENIDDNTTANKDEVEEEDIYNETELNERLKDGLLNILTYTPEDEVNLKTDGVAEAVAEPSDNIIVENISDGEDIAADVIDEAVADEVEEISDIEDSSADVVADEINDIPIEDVVDADSSDEIDVVEDTNDTTIEDVVEADSSDEIDVVEDTDDTIIEDVVEADSSDEIDVVEDTDDTTIEDVVEADGSDEIDVVEDTNDTTIEDIIDDVDTELWNIVAAMETLDDILDYAFEQKNLNENSKALYAYSEALRIYRDDSYAPFIAIDMINICKAIGDYDKALRIYDDALSLPAVADSPDMQQEFINIRSYLT